MHDPSDMAALPASALADAAEGVLLFDAAGRLQFANRAAERILGRAAADLVGRSASDPVFCPRPAGPEERGHPAVLRALLEGARVHGERCVLVRDDGARALVSVTAIPIEGEAGRLEGAVVFLEDVTARATAEDAWRAAEGTLRTFMDRSPDAIVIHRAGRIVYANPAVLRLLGYASADELVGGSVLDLTYPDDREAVRRRVERMSRHGEPVPLAEERFLRKDGGVFSAEVFALPIVYEGELAMLAFGHDLSQRKWADAERRRLLQDQVQLRDEAQRRTAELRGILDNMASGLFVCDRTGMVTLSNQAAAETLGLEASEVVNRPLSELGRRLQLRDSDGSPLSSDDDPLRRALRGETVSHQELVITKPEGGERHLRASAAPIRGERGDVVAAVGVFRDATELVEFDRLKDQFIRVVAHELKTPVTIMKGYAQILLRGDGAPPPGVLEAIVRGADRIDRIVKDITEVSALHLGSMSLVHEPFDLGALVSEWVASFAPSLSAHRLRAHVEAVEVIGDRMRVERVLATLVDNAVRYSPGGGDIEVTLSLEPGYARVSVEDHGVGIPADKQARIFQRFYRAHTDTPHDYGGLGVGLYIAREIVLRLGGDMRFESVEGRGSTFSFRVPLGTRHAR